MKIIILLVFISRIIYCADGTGVNMDRNALAWAAELKLHRDFDYKNYKYHVTIFEDSATVANEIFINNNDEIIRFRHVYDFAYQNYFSDKKKGTKFKDTLDSAIMAPLNEPIDRFIPQALISYPNGNTSITKWISAARILNYTKLED